MSSHREASPIYTVPPPPAESDPPPPPSTTRENRGGKEKRGAPRWWWVFHGKGLYYAPFLGWSKKKSSTTETPNMFGKNTTEETWFYFPRQTLGRRQDPQVSMALLCPGPWVWKTLTGDLWMEGMKESAGGREWFSFTQESHGSDKWLCMTVLSFF